EPEIDPAIGPRDAALYLPDPTDRQHGASDVEWPHDVWIDMRRQAINNKRGNDANRRCNRRCQPQAAAEETAQQREVPMLDVFGDQALRRRAESEIDHAADQEHPGPDVDIDAELEAAEPARQYDLRDEGQHRAGDANEERGAGKPPRQR